MRIGIITFHASHNYGSNLQAWALQTYLEKRGHQVEIINYRSFIQKSIYFKPFDFSSRYWYKYSLLSSMKRLLLYPSSFKGMTKKWNLFEDFFKKELNLTCEYNTREQLCNASFNYDLVIAGSDQIWNYTNETSSVFFLDFLDPAIKRISYAPSLGPTPERVPIDYLKRCLCGFNAVSVREERSKEYLISNQIIDNCEVVCDPTFLLDAEDYESLISDEPLIKEPYIFFYSPSNLKLSYFEIANKLGKDMGLPVYTDRAYYPKDINKYPYIRNSFEVGPKEFLNLVKNAVCTIGSSFHLAAFSILLKKDFYTINGDKDSRTNNLLSKLGLLNRVISLSKPTLYEHKSINYSVGIVEQVGSYRKKSLEFIHKYV